TEAAEVWSTTKDTTNISALEKFIARYRDTFYAELAQARIEELNKISVATPPTPPKAAPETKPAVSTRPQPPYTMEAIPYGAPITLETAKKVMAAAEAEAAKNNWAMAIAILDSTGHLVMFHKFDNTQYGSIPIAKDKARTALDFKRASKVFEDAFDQTA